METLLVHQTFDPDIEAELDTPGKRLRHIREVRNQKQNEVAAAIGYTAAQLSNIERNTDEKSGSLYLLTALCRYYNVTSDYILRPWSNPPPARKKENAKKPPMEMAS